MTGKKRHRALTYREKEMNTMSRRKLLRYLCYKEITPETVTDRILQDKNIALTQNRTKNITNNINEHFLTVLSNDNLYSGFINSIWNLKKEFHRKPYNFENLDGLAVMCYAMTKIRDHVASGGYNTENRQDQFLEEGIQLWALGGESWNELVDYYYNFNDKEL